ncbi:MAG TPA: ABC transporter substrate-binding protein [Patescibacteria group bacterium]|nr:ABC transporter substrate-binding protein [Patescibacteria group bacterium]
MSLLNWLRGKRGWLPGVVAVLLLAVLLGGCGKGDKEKEKAKTGSDTLYIGMANPPEFFNPLMHPGIAGKFAIRFMYDTLLGMPEPNKFTPALAESFESKDNQNYIIKINPKAKWTDGKPVTAQDVVYTLNLIANPKVENSKGSYIKMLEGVDDQGQLPAGATSISGVTAVDDRTVSLKTKTPMDPNYLKSFLGFEVFIVPKHIFETIEPSAIGTSEAATKPTVTSGPFKFVTYKTNDHVEYTANADYYQGTPKLKKIFIRIMNGTNLVTELKSGNIQMVAGGGIGIVPLKDLEMLKKDSKLTVRTVPALMGQYLDVNNGLPEFNTKFRQAVTTAINRQQLVDQLYKGAAQLVPTIYTPACDAYDKNVTPVPFDPEKAKQLLAESGFDTSKELVLSVPLGNVLREQSADLIQQDLKAVGLNVKQEKLDFPTLLTRARKGEYQMILIGYGLSVDPDYSSYFVPGGSNNYAHINDPKLTKMMLDAASMTSAEQRKAAYSEIQKYMKEQQFITSLYAPDYIIAQSKNLKGGIRDFWDGSLVDLHEWTLEAK